MRWQPSRAFARTWHGSSDARHRCALGWALHDICGKSLVFSPSVCSAPSDFGCTFGVW